MSETSSGTGSCLCGAVTIRADAIDPDVGACHCGMCRKWGGGPLLAVDCGTKVNFTGEQNITVYDSSAWAERGFCSKCGSHLFYRIKKGQSYIVPAGLFEVPLDFRLDHQIFIDKKPDYYHFSEPTRNLTEAEVFAQYLPAAE